MINTKILNLLEQRNNIDPEDAEILAETIVEMTGNFEEYIKRVVDTNFMPSFYRQTCEADDIRTNVSRDDKLRSIAHNSCIDSINIMNRIAKRMDMEPPFETGGKDLDPEIKEDRFLAAKYAWTFCKENFLAQRPELRESDPNISGGER